MNDLRLAFRQLGQTPGLTTAIITTLALSIGACTVVFSVVDTLLLHPLVCPAPQQLVMLRSQRLPDIADAAASVPDFLDWRERTRSYSGICGWSGLSFSMTGEGEPRRLRAMMITTNFFDVLGIKPLLGRAFAPEEASAGHSVVMLSRQLWQDAFAGRSDVLGRTIRLDGSSFSIVGVMPADFARAGGQIGWSDIAMPFVPGPYSLAHREDRGAIWVQARMKPGVTLGEARREMEILSTQLALEYPASNRGWNVAVTPMSSYRLTGVRSMVWTLFAGVCAVQLIACANIGNLLLARSCSRLPEMALRAAFGANRSRLMRQLLTESLALSVLGGAAGVLVAFWSVDLLRNLPPLSSLQQLAFVQIDGVILVFALGLSLLTAIGFGLAPAWSVSRANPMDTLKRDARVATADPGRGLVRNLLIVIQVASSLTLLMAAGLLVRSFARLAHVDSGVDADRIAYASLWVRGQKYQNPDKSQNSAAILAFADAVLLRLQALPGIEAAAVTSTLPLANDKGNYPKIPFAIEGRAEVAPPDRPIVLPNNASPDYFRTLGIRLLRGRVFDEHDRAEAPRVVVINEALAKGFFGLENPLGHRIGFGANPSDNWSEVVGVVANVSHALDQPPMPQAYAPYAQFPSGTIVFVVRTTSAPAVIVPLLKPQIHAVDPDLAVPWAISLRDREGMLLAAERFTARLLTLFSGIAFSIAAVGIYGVIAYSVSRRTGEIGIRMALGARAGDVLRLVLGKGVQVVGFGMMLGVSGALAVGRIEALLFHTSAHDPVTFLVVVLLFGVIAALACWLPARRATRVDIVEALRVG